MLPFILQSTNYQGLLQDDVPMLCAAKTDIESCPISGWRGVNQLELAGFFWRIRKCMALVCFCGMFLVSHVDGLLSF